jgi:hypothetical protein
MNTRIRLGHRTRAAYLRTGALCMLVSALPAGAQHSVLTQHNDGARTGAI